MKRGRLPLIFISWLMLYLFFTQAFSQQWEYIGLKGIEITSIVPHPTDNRILYLVGDYKIFKTVDGGASWDMLKTGLLLETDHLASIKDMAISPSNPDVLYAIWVPIDPRIFKSTDGGFTWFRIAQAYDFGGSDGLLRAIAIDPDDCQIVYLGQGGFTWGCFWKTIYGGATWYSTWYGPGVTRIAIDPVKPNIIYAVPQWYGGLRKSYDRGESWNDTGYKDSFIYAIRVDPFHNNRVFLLVYWGRCFMSIDGGDTWTECDMNQISPKPYTMMDLVFDPVRTGCIYLTANGKVYKSMDSGESWSEMSDGLDSTAQVQTLAVILDGSILYGGGKGLYEYTLETGVEQDNRMQVPQSLYCRNYPNPFNSTTTIEYVLPQPGIVRFSVYSLDGRQILYSLIKNENPGNNSITFDCIGLSSGVYLYVIEGAGYVLKGKMTVLK